ncbi:unnamed protein product [Rotaria socialis]|uniref:Uncharacterized protein n=1 Tax=Rotaria socialis TaxID=392032 RepID=A0A818H8Y6_9BILA|nr:unnamed protein product [Rotaria socialis]CAF3504524.1 unnamed protein product [Rotaria socialis]CAF4464180.1 unnamed protein product [Rotaria socialis]CAF4828834.1 unnamed protein product [Rotaria socialis]
MLRAVNQNNATTQFVPLKSINIHGKVRLFAADVTITQVFRNDEPTSIEAVYCFPIEEQAAIYGFVAQIDERNIVAELKEKKEAQQAYTQALQQGHGAYLMEQDEKSQDNFIINVGALPPSKECTITISYVTELELVQGSIIRFVVPTTIAPRYNPDKHGIASPAGTTTKYVQTSPYTIEFCCQVENLGGSQIARINSSSHPIEIDLAQRDSYTVKLAQNNTHLDRDILISIELAEKHDNLIATIEPGAVMATFMPTEDDCQRVTKCGHQTNEFIFVVDCSGSMRDESKIELARQAILLFLKSLPMDCHFNIIRFGSSYAALFNDISVIYNEENARKAEALVKTMQADLGGTELLEPLKWLEKYSPTQGRSRQIFLLTDGEISNVTEVLDLCRSMASSSRIFSFGLGHSPSRSLVKGLARATNGRFVFIPPNTTVDVHVGEQLRKALQQCITNVKVIWNLGTAGIETAPTQLPPVYAQDRLIVYGLFDDQSNAFDHNSSVELKVDQQQLSVAKINRIPSISENGMIARLAAKALILELQHAKRKTIGSQQSRFQTLIDEPNNATILDVKENEKKRIIELSLKHNILSPHTAFIGIEKRIDGNNTNMVLREVPIQISADDQILTSSPQMRINAARCLSPSYTPYAGPFDVCRRSSGGRGGRGDISTLYSRMYDPKSRLLYTDSMQPQQQQCTSMPRSSCMVSFCSNSFQASNLMGERQRMQSRSRSRSPPQCDEMSSQRSRKQSSHVKIPSETLEWPTNNQDIVRHLIDIQDFNGLWYLDAESIRHLTGKVLADFESIHTDVSVLTSAIVLILLETRFGAFASMWHGVAQKARTIIIEKLGKDPKNLDTLLESIRKKL